MMWAAHPTPGRCSQCCSSPPASRTISSSPPTNCPLSTGSSPPPSPTAQTHPQVSALKTDKPLDPQLPPMPLPCSFCPHHLSTFTVTLFSSQPQALHPHLIPPWQDLPPGCVIFSYLASLCPSFLICKMGLMVVPTP